MCVANEGSYLCVCDWTFLAGLCKREMCLPKTGACLAVGGLNWDRQKGRFQQQHPEDVLGRQWCAPPAERNSLIICVLGICS